MIPSYKEQVKITVVEQQDPANTDIQQLRQDLHRLTLTVEYLTREKQRLKEQLNDLSNRLKKQ